MIVLFPKLYRTTGANYPFIKLNTRVHPQGMDLWQGVRKIVGPIYRKVYPPFFDWPGMFERIE